MRLNFNMQMLEHMSDGVVLLNRQAQVVAHNTASGAWIGLCKEKGTALKLLIDQAISGRVELPVKLNLFARSQADGVPPADAWLCKDGLQNYAVFLSPHKQAVVDQAVAEKRFVSLLGEEIRGQMQQLRILLQALEEGSSFAALAAQCIFLDTLLREINDLSLLMQRTAPFDDERLKMDQMVQDLLPRLQQQFANPFVFKPGSARQGVLYGNAHWLSYALRALLAELGNSAPPGSEIVINTHQMGGFIVLTGNVAVQFGRDAVHKAGASTGDVQKTAGGRTDTAQMLIAKRIIELHSGKLKINFLQPSATGQEAGQVMGSFTLTVQTGVSGQQPSCAECPVAQQAQLYATDIAILLAGK